MPRRVGSVGAVGVFDLPGAVPRGADVLLPAGVPLRVVVRELEGRIFPLPARRPEFDVLQATDGYNLRRPPLPTGNIADLLPAGAPAVAAV